MSIKLAMYAHSGLQGKNLKNDLNNIDDGNAATVVNLYECITLQLAHPRKLCETDNLSYHYKNMKIFNKRIDLSKHHLALPMPTMVQSERIEIVKI